MVDRERQGGSRLESRPIRVVVADDHDIVRSSIVELLEEEPDLVVVAVARNGQEAIAATAEHQPDAIVMDIHMPGVDGIEATRLIARQRPGIAIVGLSMEDADVEQTVRDAGAVAFASKEGLASSLAPTLRRAVRRRAAAGSSD